MLRVRHHRAWTRADSAQPHPGHQPPDALAPDAAALVAQLPRHLTAAVERRLHELRADQLPQCQVQRALGLARAIPCRPATSDQRALPGDRQHRVPWRDHLSPPGHAHRPEALTKIPLRHELTDLGVQLLDLALLLGCLRLSLAGEDPAHALESLPLPGVDKGLLSPELCHQLGDRQLASDRLKRHLRLDPGAVILSFASHAVLPHHRWPQA